VVNVCTGLPTTVNELAAAIAGKFAPAPGIVHTEARPGDIKRSVGDSSLAARLLGWKPSLTLDEGLTALVASEVARKG
jgi:UDP-glucose 4-epimerase